VGGNLALALYSRQRYAEAEDAARAALRLNPTMRNAQYALGLTLAAQRRAPEEAIQKLAAVADTLPRARLVLAGLLSDKGDRNQAAAELRKYLASGDPVERQQVKVWLAQLEHQ
jgi:tetratricopeptide (TPR) repeat protein